jgi:hypothetical protein
MLTCALEQPVEPPTRKYDDVPCFMLALKLVLQASAEGEIGFGLNGYRRPKIWRVFRDVNR